MALAVPAAGLVLLGRPRSRRNGRPPPRTTPRRRPLPHRSAEDRQDRGRAVWRRLSAWPPLSRAARAGASLPDERVAMLIVRDIGLGRASAGAATGNACRDARCLPPFPPARTFRLPVYALGSLAGRRSSSRVRRLSACSPPLPPARVSCLPAQAGAASRAGTPHLKPYRTEIFDVYVNVNLSYYPAGATSGMRQRARGRFRAAERCAKSAWSMSADGLTRRIFR